MPTKAPCPYQLDGAGSDIHGEAAALRDLGPATPVALPGLAGDIPAWSVTDPGLIRRLLTDPAISKDAHQHWPAYRDGQIPPNWPLRIWVDVRNALTAYGTGHTRLRKPLASAFTTRRVRALEPRIRTIADQLLSDLRVDEHTGTVDLRAGYAWQLPLMVVNTVLGVPDDMHNGFRDAVSNLFSTARTEDEGTTDRAEIYRLVTDLINHKSRYPDDDVTTSLIHAAQRGELTSQELCDSLLLLIGAGHETTVGLIDHSTVNLLSHPRQLAAAMSGHVGWDQVVEETLRHQPPIASILLRFAVQDVHDDATNITFRQGDALVINYAAAGRDPAHGPTTDQFDVTRTTSRDHLSFGHGTHYCLGAELARLEGRIALEALTTRYPHLTLAVDPSQLKPLPSFISNGHEQIPVHLQLAA